MLSTDLLLEAKLWNSRVTFFSGESWSVALELPPYSRSVNNSHCWRSSLVWKLNKTRCVWGLKSLTARKRSVGCTLRRDGQKIEELCFLLGAWINSSRGLMFTPISANECDFHENQANLEPLPTAVNRNGCKTNYIGPRTDGSLSSSHLLFVHRKDIICLWNPQCLLSIIGVILASDEHNQHAYTLPWWAGGPIHWCSQRTRRYCCHERLSPVECIPLSKNSVQCLTAHRHIAAQQPPFTRNYSTSTDLPAKRSCCSWQKL